MNKSTFYRELYRFLEREDSGVWGWVNLSDEEYKNINLELSNARRKDGDASYSAEEKELYPFRLKVRLKRLLYSYVRAAEKCGMSKSQLETSLKELGEICDALVLAYNKAAGGERSSAIGVLSERIFKNIQFSDFNMVLAEMDEELRKKKKQLICLKSIAIKKCVYTVRDLLISMNYLKKKGCLTFHSIYLIAPIMKGIAFAVYPPFICHHQHMDVGWK